MMVLKRIMAMADKKDAVMIVVVLHLCPIVT